MLKSIFLLIFLFLKPIRNSLRSGFVLVFCLSLVLQDRHFVWLHRIFFHQIEKQEEIIKYKKENFMISVTL